VWSRHETQHEAMLHEIPHRLASPKTGYYGDSIIHVYFRSEVSVLIFGSTQFFLSRTGVIKSITNLEFQYFVTFMQKGIMSIPERV